MSGVFHALVGLGEAKQYIRFGWPAFESGPITSYGSSIILVLKVPVANFYIVGRAHRVAYSIRLLDLGRASNFLYRPFARTFTRRRYRWLLFSLPRLRFGVRFGSFHA